ncbi:leucyl aminopeptidase [Roseibacillus persicicus]|nr:leucyl aminopeptidase [Roseibacillus persicicus]
MPVLRKYALIPPMKVSFVSAQTSPSGLTVLPVFDKKKFAGNFPEKTRKEIAATLTASKLDYKPSSYLVLHGLPDRKNSPLVLWYVGSKKDFNPETFSAEVMATFRTQAEKTLTFQLDGLDLSPEACASAAVGAQLAGYRFDKHRFKPAPHTATTITHLRIASDNRSATRSAYQRFAGPVCEGQLLARDLVNEPANVLFPKAYAKRIKALKEVGLEVEVLGEKEMKALKMNALLGVGQGSPRESQLVIMKWMGGKKSEAPLCLVGKGITFDTGGISLKPVSGMWDMKGDMGGSAAVVGTMQALAQRGAKANVIGLVALAENMPDGRAQNPGDVITSMSGQTIELQSTDAEGRLVLADALWYAKERFQPRAMVDLATLTGAVLVALGHEHAGLFTNSDQLADEFMQSGLTADEKTWRLPLGPAYDKLLNSETADMKNSCGREAGSITAAQFLQRFVDETPWVHLDIAGTSSKNSRSDPREPSFAIGFGVRLLNQWIADHYEG